MVGHRVGHGLHHGLGHMAHPMFCPHPVLWNMANFICGTWEHETDLGEHGNRMLCNGGRRVGANRIEIKDK